MSKGSLYGEFEACPSIDIVPCFDPSCNVNLMMTKYTQSTFQLPTCKCSNPSFYCHQHQKTNVCKECF